MVESKPPNCSPKRVDEPKVTYNKDKNPQCGKSNNQKKKNNKNQTSPGSTPSGMTKFTGKTRILQGVYLTLDLKNLTCMQKTTEKPAGILEIYLEEISKPQLQI